MTCILCQFQSCFTGNSLYLASSEVLSADRIKVDWIDTRKERVCAIWPSNFHLTQSQLIVSDRWPPNLPAHGSSTRTWLLAFLFFTNKEEWASDGDIVLSSKSLLRKTREGKMEWELPGYSRVESQLHSLLSSLDAHTIYLAITVSIDKIPRLVNATGQPQNNDRQ